MWVRNESREGESRGAEQPPGESSSLSQPGKLNNSASDFRPTAALSTGQEDWTNSATYWWTAARAMGMTGRTEMRETFQNVTAASSPVSSSKIL